MTMNFCSLLCSSPCFVSWHLFSKMKETRHHWQVDDPVKHYRYWPGMKGCHSSLKSQSQQGVSVGLTLVKLSNDCKNNWIITDVTSSNSANAFNSVEGICHGSQDGWPVGGGVLSSKWIRSACWRRTGSGWSWGDGRQDGTGPHSRSTGDARHSNSDSATTPPPDTTKELLFHCCDPK